MTAYWLTDRPETAGRLLADGVGDWKPVAPEEAGTAFALFAPGRGAWRFGEGTDEGAVIIVDDAGESQFDVMLRADREGFELPERLICLALTGSGFRGQRQRPWSALRGNLHLTARYRVDLPAAEIRPALTMIPAVAAAEAIEAVSHGRLAPSIKWVNDVLVRGAKVSGVLTAASQSGERIDRVIFGIGMNIDAAPAIEPTPFVPEAGCLAGFDDSLRGGLPEVFHEITARLDALLRLVQDGDIAEIFARYRSRAGFIGQEVVIWPDGTEDTRATKPLHRGRVLTLNPDLSLRLEGHPAPVRQGRMAMAG
jgi:biotin-[acetyl-CoA-carboxylase] ligase BirA-like protein